MTERIVVPLDGSAMAEGILTRLRPLLKRKDAEITLVRAVEMAPSEDFGRIIEILCNDARRYVKNVERQLADAGVRVGSIVRPGSAGVTILEAVDEVKATMIAMTTHGRSGLARWALGSVAEKILRASPVPVLLLRSFQEGLDGPGKPAPVEEQAFHKILVPIDGSRTSIEIVPPAIAFARLFGSRILVLSVQEPAFHSGGFTGTMIEAPMAKPTPPSKDITAEDLATFAGQSFAAAGIPTTTFTVAGEPATTILQFARDQKVDLIAMTTHGRSGPSRWVFGSVTEKILRAAPGTMLVVRAGTLEKGTTS